MKKSEWSLTLTSAMWKGSHLHLSNGSNSSLMNLLWVMPRAALHLLNLVKFYSWEGMLFTLLWTAQVFSVCGRLFQREGCSGSKIFSVLFSYWFYSHWQCLTEPLWNMTHEALPVSVVDGKPVKQKHFLLYTFFLKSQFKSVSFVLFIVCICCHSSYCL